MELGLFQGEFMFICFHLNGPYFPVSLYALWFLFLSFFFLSWTFETSDGVTLEIRFSFPGLLIFQVLVCFLLLLLLYSLRISLMCKLKVFSGLFWALLWACTVHYLIFPTYAVFLNVFVSVSGFIKGKQQKMKWGCKGHWTFPYRSHFSRHGMGFLEWRTCDSNGCPRLYLLFYDQEQCTVITLQIPDICEDWVPFFLPGC